MFVGISKEICEQADKILAPAIARAVKRGVTNKLAGCIVVLDPRMPYIGQAADNLPVIFKSTINDELADAKYVQIAYHKAWLTFKYRLPSAIIQQQYPYLYAEGNTKWGGSTIDDGGLIVAFSGVQAVFDEMIAEWYASSIRALCRWEMTKPDGVMSSDSSFIGADS